MFANSIRKLIIIQQNKMPKTTAIQFQTYITEKYHQITVNLINRCLQRALKSRTTTEDNLKKVKADLKKEKINVRKLKKQIKKLEKKYKISLLEENRRKISSWQ
jgi:hypothetical protein